MIENSFLQSVYEYKSRKQIDLPVKGLGSLALIAIEEEVPGAAGNLNWGLKFELWKAARKVRCFASLLHILVLLGYRCCLQHYKSETKEAAKRTCYRPQKHLQASNKVQCFDGCRVWEGVVWGVATDVRGVRLYNIKFDEVSDGIVRICTLLTSTCSFVMTIT